VRIEPMSPATNLVSFVSQRTHGLGRDALKLVEWFGVVVWFIQVFGFDNVVIIAPTWKYGCRMASTLTRGMP
jgi:hypothetical protein